jgi:hypothetical protein
MGDKMTNTSTVRTAFLVLAALALGCDSEGYSAQAGVDAGTVEADPTTGPGRGAPSVVFTVPDVQAVTVPQDAGPVASPDTMPAVVPDALVLADTMPVATGLASLRACPAPRIFSSVGVCPGKWQGDKKSFCIESGQDADRVIVGGVVKYGEQPCTAMGVSDSVSGRVVIVVIPGGACDVFCKPTN